MNVENIFSGVGGHGPYFVCHPPQFSNVTYALYVIAI